MKSAAYYVGTSRGKTGIMLWKDENNNTVKTFD